MKKSIVAVLVVIAVGVAGFFIFRFVGGSSENSWVCIDGQWIQRGNPTSSMPQIGCGDGAVTGKVQDTQNTQEKATEAQDRTSGEFKSGQTYTTYATDEFEVKYPANWLQVEQSQIIGGVVPEVAVTNVGCSFVIKKTPLPEGTSFEEYVQNLVQVEMKKMPVRVVKQDSTKTTAYFESEISMGSTTVTSISHSFLTSKRNSIGVAFLAQKKDFEQSCGPVLADVFDSVVVK